MTAQHDPTPILTFTEATANPVITLGEEGEWDSLLIGVPHIVYDEGVFHLFYLGAGDSFRSVGYATSVDGFAFTKHENNPLIGREVFTQEPFLEFIIGECGFSGLSVVQETDHWRMYLSPNGCGLDAWTPGGDVLIASASALAGPWTTQLSPDDYDVGSFMGGAGNWDSVITVDSVILTEEGYILYYSGLSDTSRIGGSSIGRATSSDGRGWIKYHDPVQEDPLYAASSPVLTYGPHEDWDNFYVQRAAVRQTENGWEMFYSGHPVVNHPNPSNRRGPPSIGYAYSTDGIRWIPSAAPVLQATNEQVYEFASFVVVDEVYYLYYSYVSLASGTRAIGVATGTIEWVTSADASPIVRRVRPFIPFPPGPVGLPAINVYGAVDGRVVLEALTRPNAWETVEGAASYTFHYRRLSDVQAAGTGSAFDTFIDPAFIMEYDPESEYWFTLTAQARSGELLAYTELILYSEPETPAEAAPSIDDIIAEADDGTVHLPAEGEWTITYLDQLVCGSNSWDYVVMNLNPSTLTVEDDGTALTLTNATWGSVRYMRVAPNVYQLAAPPISLMLNSLIMESTLVVRSTDLISGQQVDERPNLPTCQPAAFRLDFAGGEITAQQDAPLVDTTSSTETTTETGCIVSAAGNVNQRSQPSTAAAVSGTLQAGQSAAVIGQATDAAGFVWWQLGENIWVRSDVAAASGDCENVPVSQP